VQENSWTQPHQHSIMTITREISKEKVSLVHIMHCLVITGQDGSKFVLQRICSFNGKTWKSRGDKKWRSEV
jgi:ABC-type hemin transport system ATPase subunit